MALTVSSGNNYQSTSLPSESAERTLLCWVNPGSITGVQQLFSRDDAGGALRSYQFRLDSGEATYIRFVSGVFAVLTTASSGIAIGAWSCIIAVDRGDGDQEVYVDGVSRGTDTDAGAADVDDSGLGIGVRYDVTGNVAPLAGDLGPMCSWDHAKTAGEIAALSAGFSPDFYPNGTIWSLDPVRSSSAATIYGKLGLAFAENGTTADATHPPNIIYPSSLFVPSVETPVVLGRQYSGMSAINRMG